MDHSEKWVTLWKWVTFGKIGHTIKMDHFWENASHCFKWVTLRKVCNKWKNGSHWKMGHTAKKWVTFGKMAHSVKNRWRLEKSVKLLKMGDIWKNRSYYIKMDHFWENGYFYKMGYIWKSRPQVEQRVTQQKIGRTVRHGSHFKK